MHMHNHLDLNNVNLFQKQLQCHKYRSVEFAKFKHFYFEILLETLDILKGFTIDFYQRALKH
jgi:hypothetical protein